MSCFLIFAVLLGSYIHFNFFSNESKNLIKKVVVNDVDVNPNIQINGVEELRKKYNNSDVVGIINIEGIDLNEAIMQSTDNSFYLNHNEYKDYDAYGSIFMDYRINPYTSKKILIFGHNSSYIDTPFGNLENYYSEDYYQNHKYITIQIESEIRKYEIFSVYVETSDWTYMNLNFSNDEEWYNHLVILKNNSLYDTNVEINASDEILILQTCSNNKDYSNYDKKYLLIISKRIKN